MIFIKNKTKKNFSIFFDPTDQKKLFKIISFMLIGMILELFGVGLIFPAVKVLTDNEFLTKIYNLLGIKALDTEILLLVIAIIFVIFFGLKNIYLWIVLKKYSVFINHYEAKLQTKLFKGYLNKSVSYFKEKNSSDIIINIKEISSYFCSIYISALMQLALESILQISILILLFYFSWQSTLPIFTLFGGFALIIFSYSKNALIELGKQRNELSKSQLLNVQEGIGGIKEIKLLGRENFFLDQFEKNTYSLLGASIKHAVIAGTPRFVIEFFAVSSVALIIFIYSTLGRSIAEILPILGLFFVCAYKIVPSLNKTLLLMNRVKFSTDMVDKTLHLLNEFKNEQVDFHKDTLRKKMIFKKKIELKNIKFKYLNREKIILKDINISINKNSFIGISGESGSGKSTLIDIIMGITNPDSGSIKVDGKSISESIKEWQKNIGYVSQNIFLIPSTIKRNIAFGLSDDQINEELINEVIKKASLTKFVDSLELGINTHIGEGGALISGGQKQRIGIARSLFNKPELLIFDEATSALDLETEREILNEISNLKKEFTLILISHRESSIKYCDERYLMENENLSKISGN